MPCKDCAYFDGRFDYESMKDKDGNCTLNPAWLTVEPYHYCGHFISRYLSTDHGREKYVQSLVSEINKLKGDLKKQRALSKKYRERTKP